MLVYFDHNDSCKHNFGYVVGTQYEYLLSAVLRVVVSSSCYRYPYPSRLILDSKSTDSRTMTVSKFLSNLPKGLSLDVGAIPLRFAIVTLWLPGLDNS